MVHLVAVTNSPGRLNGRITNPNDPISYPLILIMKTRHAACIVAACTHSAMAQVAVEKSVSPAPPVEAITETVPAAAPAAAKRQLLTQPRPVPAHPPGTVVETTETKSYVDVPGQPRRIYNVERSVVIVEGKELPYITIPVLFEKETAKLLDRESRIALEQTAAAIHEALKTSPDALFDIEGHTSTDGTSEWNQSLSADRARRTHRELTERYLVPSSALSAHGYGEMFPLHPEGNEEQMALDRRVLVVRKW